MAYRSGVNLQEVEPQAELYVPEPARIVKVEPQTAKEKLFEVELTSGRALGTVRGSSCRYLCRGSARRRYRCVRIGLGARASSYACATLARSRQRSTACGPER